ncbi:hypothetical protein [Priestia megaterium]|uniref:hypothetical protein n=1 Tax=Priestia megaterium TaxID=1404 RepID=UPI0012A97990|nr:hypothetical protein [Priestia megaterium]QFY71376.1 hypothetical protein CEQ83_02200 [Priestia megaterium]
MCKDLVSELLNQGFNVVDLKLVGHKTISVEKEIWLNETSSEEILDMVSLDKDSVEYYLNEQPPYFEGKTKPLAGYVNSEGEVPTVQDTVASFKVFILPSQVL